MNILKTNKEYKQNTFKYKNITIQENNIIPSKILVNLGQYTIMEHNLSSNIQFITEAINKEDNNFLFISKRFDDDLLITPTINRKSYQFYNFLILNVIRKNKLKILKGRVVNYGHIGINGIIAPLPTVGSFNKRNKKKRSNSSPLLKTLTFWGENIQQNNKNSKMKVNVSRKKFIKFFKKHNATI